jgi:hypothetical protein
MISPVTVRTNSASAQNIAKTDRVAERLSTVEAVQERFVDVGVGSDEGAGLQSTTNCLSSPPAGCL